MGNFDIFLLGSVHLKLYVRKGQVTCCETSFHFDKWQHPDQNADIQCI